MDRALKKAQIMSWGVLITLNTQIDRAQKSEGHFAVDLFVANLFVTQI